jgi:cell division transport system ATP-binding protein
MKFSHVTLSYRERSILKDISLDIQPGEFVFLIGASGSWKTSIIRSMIGAIKPKQWRIYDDTQRDIATLSARELLKYRRSMWIIFQDFKLLARKTVRENVAFAMEVCWYDRHTIIKRIPEVLSAVGLLEKQWKFVETLSWGEIQRTCIARALIHHPNIIIWDEPTWNLDRKNATEIMLLLDALNKNWKTIIMATHDESIVNSMKKRVIAFKDGIIVSDQQEWTYCL